MGQERRTLRDRPQDRHGRGTESGQTMPEYVLLLALVAIVVVAAVSLGRATVDSIDRGGEATASFTPPRTGCDPNYAGACLPRHPPDVDCSDLGMTDDVTVRVSGSDPHGLDDDGNGIVCD